MPVLLLFGEELVGAHGDGVLTADSCFSPALREVLLKNLPWLSLFAYLLLPRVIAAHNADTSWPTVRRTAEIRAAAQSLIARYEQKIADFDAANAAAALDTDG